MTYNEQEMWIDRVDPRDATKRIHLFGVLRIPEGARTPLPAVICSHGFTANHKEADPYAIALAQAGVVTLALDFFGGGAEVRSDGTLLDMTVATEADDLTAFVDAMATLPEVDGNRIGLLGCSQGGFVSTMVAARMPERIWRLALMYPAFVLHDDAVRSYPNPDDIPDSYLAFPGYELSRISRAYNLVARETDPYELMGLFAKDVLIVHGDNDTVVPLTYSKKAQRTFANARLIVSCKGTHGFTNEQLDHATGWVCEFFTKG